METMEVRDAIFMAGVVLAIFIFNWYRNQMVIRFLVFCGQENPDPDFAKAVNSIHYVNLDLYQESLKHYFLRLIASDNGNKIEQACTVFCSIDKKNKEDLCRAIFSEALLMTDAKKLADFCITIVRADRESGKQALSFITDLSKTLPNHKKELFRSELDQERVTALVIEKNAAVSEKLAYLMLEVRKD